MNWGKIKKFVYASSKIAVAIFLVVFVLGTIAGGYSYWVEIKENQQEKKLAEMIEWSPNEVKSLDVTFYLTTKFQDKKIHYIFNITNYNEKIDEAKDQSNSKCTLVFYDGDGFKLDEIEVYLNDMTRIVDDNGEPLSLTFNGSEYMNIDTYENIQRWSSRWNF